VRNGESIEIPKNPYLTRKCIKMHVGYTQGHSSINKCVLSKSGDLKLAEMGTELVADTLSDARGFINVLLSLSDCTLVCRTLENLSLDEFVGRKPRKTLSHLKGGESPYIQIQVKIFCMKKMAVRILLRQLDRKMQP